MDGDYAQYARCIYEGSKVRVVVRQHHRKMYVELPRPDRGSHRKTAERALEKLGMHPSSDFHYGWEIRD